VRGTIKIMAKVFVERTEDGYVGTNERGARVSIGSSDQDGVFSPVELLLVALGGCDVLAFTGGIGENGIAIREAICRNLSWAGIELDKNKNQNRGQETEISAVESDTRIWIVPTNEELIVARQTVAVLSAN